MTQAENQNLCTKAPEKANEPAWLDLVRQQVGSLRFGVVQIVVHDAQVTQIEKTERLRLEKPPRK